GVAIDSFERGGHIGRPWELRPCRSMEFKGLARRGTGMADGRVGPLAARPKAYFAGVAPVGATTRASRGVISARPPAPRVAITSGEERPLIFSASSAS